MSAARQLRLRSARRRLIVLALCVAAGASACATTSQPVPKLKPKKEPAAAVVTKKAEPPPPAEKEDPPPPDKEDLEALESDFQPAKESADVPVKCGAAKRSSSGARDGLAWPVDGVVIASYGKREGTPHDGIDIAAPRGTPIYASRTGEVLYSGERPGYGHTVILGHDGGMVTIYAHNEENCVEQGARVEQGEVIGLVGKSGGQATPAVHFEVRVENKPVNPRAHLPK